MRSAIFNAQYCPMETYQALFTAVSLKTFYSTAKISMLMQSCRYFCAKVPLTLSMILSDQPRFTKTVSAGIPMEHLQAGTRSGIYELT